MKPETLLFAKTHEWVAVATEGGQKVATVGLTEFAVQALTDLVFIELPKVGRQVKAGESFCEVESVKAVSDVYAPVAGEVVAVVCHGGVINAYVSAVLGLADPIFFEPEYTGFSRVLVSRGGTRSIRSLNEAPHLR